MNKVLFIFKENKLYGFVDETKNILIQPKYLEVKEFINEQTFVKTNDGWILIDVNEKKIVNNTFDDVLYFDENIAVVKNKKDFFVIAQENQNIKKLPYDFVSFNDGIFLLTNKNQFAFFNIELNQMFDLWFENAKNFSDGFACVYKNNKWGVINKKNEVIIDYKYDDIWTYSFFLFKVKLNNSTFFIDIKGKEYLQQLTQNYVFFDHFKNHGIVFTNKKKMGFMNEFFEILFLTKYKIMSDFENDVAPIKKENKYALVNINGRKITKFIFDKVLYHTNHYVCVEINNQINYFNLEKKKLIF